MIVRTAPKSSSEANPESKGRKFPSLALGSSGADSSCERFRRSRHAPKALRPLAQFGARRITGSVVAVAHLTAVSVHLWPKIQPRRSSVRNQDRLVFKKLEGDLLGQHDVADRESRHPA